MPPTNAPPQRLAFLSPSLSLAGEMGPIRSSFSLSRVRSSSPAFPSFPRFPFLLTLENGSTHRSNDLAGPTRAAAAKRYPRQSQTSPQT